MKPKGHAPRFWAKVDKSGECWLWTAGKTHDGYGQFWLNGTHRCAHRVAYELAYGPIPDGLELDHTCHNHACVNPDHLRPVTNAANGQNRAGADRDSKTGIRGVDCPSRGRWRARGKLDGKLYHLGYFDTAEEAESAVTTWRQVNMPYSIMDQQLPRKGTER